MKKIRFSSAIAFFFLLESLNALKFYLKDGIEKCFLDEIPDQNVRKKNIF
jgi:hypothetical protein